MDTSLIAELRALASKGYTSDFQAASIDGEVLCLTCHQRFPASTLDADVVVRLEGASDPADMLAIVAAICPHCDAHGTLVLAYGPSSTSEEVGVLRSLERATPRPPLACDDEPAELLPSHRVGPRS
jgi:hypothetical protein